jgi:hypothetical protein
MNPERPVVLTDDERESIELAIRELRDQNWGDVWVNPLEGLLARAERTAERLARMRQDDIEEAN